MPSTKQHEQSATTVAQHIKELRTRLAISLLALVIAGVAVYLVYEPLLSLLRAPLNAPLYYNTPAGSFSFIMKICFMGALAITIPLIIYNLIMFIRPAFEENIPKRRVYLTAAMSAFLGFSGAAFAYYFIIPGALRFFAGFQVQGLSALISADSYLNFVTNAIITFILLFQLPLLIVFIDSIKPLPPKRLVAMEKWVVLGSLIISFLVPFALDITTSLLIALPIIVLYNIAFIAVLARHSHTKRRIRAFERSMNNVARIPSSSLTLSSLSFEDLISSETPATGDHHSSAPVHSLTTATAIKPISNPQRRVGMDIRPATSRPQKVMPAEWVHRVHDPVALPPKAKIISDIGPRRQAI